MSRGSKRSGDPTEACRKSGGSVTVRAGRCGPAAMTIPTEPIGSIPRPLALIEAVKASGDNAEPKLEPLYEAAIRDTIERFEATGSPVISDGEQRKYHNFWTYCVHGLPKIDRKKGGRMNRRQGRTRIYPRTGQHLLTRPATRS